MSLQQFCDWLLELGIEFDSLTADKRVEYKATFDKSRNGKYKYLNFPISIFN